MPAHGIVIRATDQAVALWIELQPVWSIHLKPETVTNRDIIVLK